MKTVLVRLPFALLAWWALSLRAEPLAGQEWKTFTDPEGRFSILMPGTPERETQSEPTTKEKVGSTTHMFTIKGGDNNIYIAGVTLYDPVAKMDVEGELAADRDDFNKEVSAKLIKDSRRKFGDYPALQFRSSSAQAYFSALVVMAGNHCYMAVAAYHTPAEPAEVTRFLNSLKLISP